MLSVVSDRSSAIPLPTVGRVVRTAAHRARDLLRGWPTVIAACAELHRLHADTDLARVLAGERYGDARYDAEFRRLAGHLLHALTGVHDRAAQAAAVDALRLARRHTDAEDRLATAAHVYDLLAAA